MKFVIRSRSSGNRYEIELREVSGTVILTCSCPAGDSLQYCKHRFALIDGDSREVLEGAGQLPEFARLIGGSRMPSALKSVRDQEKIVEAEQVELKRRKVMLAKIMHGQA